MNTLKLIALVDYSTTYMKNNSQCQFEPLTLNQQDWQVFQCQAVQWRTQKWLSNIDLMTVLNYIYVVEIGVNYRKTDRKYWKKFRLMRLLVAEWSLKMMLWIIWLHLCNTNTSIKVIMTSFSREIAAGNSLDFIHIFKIIMPKVNS